MDYRISVDQYNKRIAQGDSADRYVALTIKNRRGDTVPIAYLQRPESTSESVRLSAPEVRSAVWQKSGGSCWYCQKKIDPFLDYHIDHVVPRSKGGMDVIENLVPSCSHCNLSKGTKSVAAWRGAR